VPSPWAYPAILGLYIFGLALVAELETRRCRRWELLLGGLMMGLAVLLALLRLAFAEWPGHILRSGAAGPLVLAVLLLPPLAITALLAWRVGRSWWRAVVEGRRQVGPAVGAALGGIILLDALIVSAAHPIILIPVALCYLVWLGLGAAIRMD
jgi:hypothetical protein